MSGALAAISVKVAARVLLVCMCGSEFCAARRGQR